MQPRYHKLSCSFLCVSFSRLHDVIIHSACTTATVKVKRHFWWLSSDRYSKQHNSVVTGHDQGVDADEDEFSTQHHPCLAILVGCEGVLRRGTNVHYSYTSFDTLIHTQWHRTVSIAIIQLAKKFRTNTAIKYGPQENKSPRFLK